LKDNAVYEVAEECSAPQNRGIVSHSLIRFNAGKAKEDCPCLLRRVAVWDADNEREIVLLTNHPGFGATTIAAIYRDGWKIELFFKALKQNLRIKTFVGTSENALRIQIWTTLNRASPVQTAAPPLSSAVVALQPRFHAPTESVYLQAATQLIGRSLSNAAAHPGVRATQACAFLIPTFPHNLTLQRQRSDT